MSVSLATGQIRAILLDIEGTTTPIAFVHEVLFPYAREHTAAFLRAHPDSPEVRRIVGRLRLEHAAESATRPGPPVWLDGTNEATERSVVAYVFWLMDRDRKSPGLKELQGLIWDEGYRTGRLRGEVFDDVPAALERWHRAGIDVRIFSSGSVLAQQLLFRTVPAGDLTSELSGYFDTAVGPKTSPESYLAITATIGLPPEQIVFLSDTVGELDAARAAGLRTILTIRPGNASPPPHTHRSIRSFDEIVA